MCVVPRAGAPLAHEPAQPALCMYDDDDDVCSIYNLGKREWFSGFWNDAKLVGETRWRGGGRNEHHMARLVKAFTVDIVIKQKRVNVTAFLGMPVKISDKI